MAKSDQLPTGAFQPIASNWCHSLNENIKVDFEWTIHDYELCTPAKLESAKFPFKEESSFGSRPLTWHLILEDEGISIHHYPWQQKAIRVRTAFVNANREKVFSKEVVVRKSSVCFVNDTSRRTLLEKSNNLIVNKNLTIYCEVTYGNLENLSGQTPSASQPCSSNEELSKDFGDFFENQKLSDIIFILGDHKFFAHKIILAARSPVFAAMFGHSSNKENITGNVNVPDIEASVFKELLRYIYTGQVPLPRMDQVAAGLLAVADKYLLENLKRTCGDHLTKRMTPDNCIELLSLGVNDPAYYLRTKAIDYVRKFPVEVMSTASWKKVTTLTAPWMEDVIKLLLESFALRVQPGK